MPQSLLQELATAAKQDDGNASLVSIDTKLDSQATQAGQDTGNASLSDIDASTTDSLALMRETLHTLVLVMNQVLENAPRVDATRRVIVSLAESNTVAIQSGQTLSVVGQLQQFGTSGRQIDAIPHHVSNIGELHLLNQLKFTP